MEPRKVAPETKNEAVYNVLSEKLESGKSVGLAIIDGTITLQELKVVERNIPNKYRVYTSKDILQEIVSLISPYLSEHRLYELVEKLCPYEMEKNDAFRNSTLAKFFIVHENNLHLQKDKSSQKKSAVFISHIHRLALEKFKADGAININGLANFLEFNFDIIDDSKLNDAQLLEAMLLRKSTLNRLDAKTIPDTEVNQRARTFIAADPHFDKSTLSTAAEKHEHLFEAQLALLNPKRVVVSSPKNCKKITESTLSFFSAEDKDVIVLNKEKLDIEGRLKANKEALRFMRDRVLAIETGIKELPYDQRSTLKEELYIRADQINRLTKAKEELKMEMITNRLRSKSM